MTEDTLDRFQQLEDAMIITEEKTQDDIGAINLQILSLWQAIDELNTITSRLQS